MKVSIQVTTGSNEAIVVESDLKNPHEWPEKIAPVFQYLEGRVGDRSRRLMAANKQLKELGATSPEQANLVHNLVLLALGQMPQITTEGLVDGGENSLPVIQREVRD